MANSQTINASASPEVQMNENYDSIDWAFVYSKRHEVTTGLTWGFRGGRWGGFSIPAGTVTLGNGINYFVVNRLTGGVLLSLGGWNSPFDFRRVYKITCAGGVVTAIEDHRSGPYGIFGYVPEINNFWHTNQSIASTVRTHLTGSNIAIGTDIVIQAGTQFRWTFSLSKTAAGTAPSTIDIGVGPTLNGTNTARVTFTKPGGTASADHGIITIDAIVRTTGASGIMVADYSLIHNGTGIAAGSVTENAVSAPFDMTVANLHVGVNVTSGAAEVFTIHRMRADSMRLGGQV